MMPVPYRPPYSQLIQRGMIYDVKIVPHKQNIPWYRDQQWFIILQLDFPVQIKTEEWIQIQIPTQ